MQYPKPEEFTKKDLDRICDMFDDLNASITRCAAIFLELTEDDPEKFQEEADDFKKLVQVGTQTRDLTCLQMFRLLGQWEQAQIGRKNK